MGRLAKSTLGNGVATSYPYDAAGRVVQIDTRDAGGAAIFAFGYGYDANNRRTRVESRDRV